MIIMTVIRCFFSGWQKSLVLTADGWGDGYSSKLYEFDNGKFTTIRTTPLLDSLGYFYGSITKLLGFKPHRHEGKIWDLRPMETQNSI